MTKGVLEQKNILYVIIKSWSWSSDNVRVEARISLCRRYTDGR